METLGITLRYSIRMFVAYEALTGKPFTGGNITALFNLLLSALATAPAVMNGTREMPSVEDVYDHIDAHPDTLEHFAQWVARSGKADELLTGTGDTDDTTGGEKKSSPSPKPSKS